MSGDASAAAELLLRAGPPLLFLMALAETAVPLGLLVPAGVAFSTGVALAYHGLLGWEAVVACAVAGALAGDSLGYWLGRGGGRLMRRRRGAGAGLRPGAGPRPQASEAAADGRAARAVARARRSARRIFHSHALVAVAGGRTVSFVRTFMPATAGASGVPYRRFLLFDGAGVAAWAALYITLGLGAAVGWEVLAARVGVAGAAIALAVLAAGVGAVALLRVSRR